MRYVRWSQSFRRGALWFCAVVFALGAPFDVSLAQSMQPDLEYKKFGETRAYFRDWLAACRPGGYCSVLSYNGAGPDAAGVDADYILRVASSSAGAALQVEFTGVAAYVGDQSPITLSIDGAPIGTLQPQQDGGWRRVPNVVNEYVFSPDAADGRLVDRMKAGAGIRVAFVDNSGAKRDVAFSLIGLTAALSWIERARMR